MNSATRDVPAPESYATFWEPIPVDTPPVVHTPAREPKDAYQDFVNITEDAPVSLQVSQIDI
ncbi:hypothetical protein GobsT_42140 [Gemmata obscuriglobus]|uniref:Uncharacterized protein n=1 Tax=Gemmata obscuriglobus TaxID=114 RepID=A0A2Z3GTP6_9BACT|nr:hypothetical protein [Gemmata obscuriglobus]AWM37769.1 hypothetical protein C1280_12700 [Gemmata obscuriglobus]QEG29418.1 hypothetical protein GobsT_42140 [Gemmata obscuriglobus]VTS08510.1 unnamed protein product [Gemmata obscuriglobus UQM 2246]